MTFVLDGRTRVPRRHHTGGEGRLAAGDAQFMTAGGGVLLAAERAGPRRRPFPSALAQPSGPTETHAGPLSRRLPRRRPYCPGEWLGSAPIRGVAGGGAWRGGYSGQWLEARLYAGRLGDVAAPLSSIWPLTLIDLMVEAGATFAMPVSAGERACVDAVIVRVDKAADAVSDRVDNAPVCAL